MSFQSLQDIKRLYEAQDVSVIYVKHLSPKQDNDKNQIYLGGGLNGITNLFPARINGRSASESTRKRKSSVGKPKLEALLQMAWFDAEGQLHDAPNARIIDYFQYPEVRLSGFLKGCKRAPDALRRRNQAEYGKRILALGLRPDGVVLGLVLTERDDSIVRNFPELPQHPTIGILQVLTVADAPKVDPFCLLKDELRQIVSHGWHPSQILRPNKDAPLPFRGNQGGGYTLEALLGVTANADKAPDKYGYELKTFRGGKISLMTPTADGGYQGDHTFLEFMHRYGHPGTKNDGSLRFTGVHRVGQINKRTGMKLVVEGYDRKADCFSGDTEEIGVAMVKVDTQEKVASWSLEHIADSWNKKHASAMYVPCEQLKCDGSQPYDALYRYSNHVFVGQGTDVWQLLRAINSGLVYYDPADSVYANGQCKVRPQWRINTPRLLATMKLLYKKAWIEEL